MKNIAVFCGSALGRQAVYAEKAYKLGKLFVENDFNLVYGSGNVGLMGILADSVLESNGTVIGVIPQHLVDVEVAHKGITKTYVVSSMSERKTLLNELSDAFVILPGGYGTLDELFEMLTLNQLSIIRKPIGVLNIEGYFDKLFEMINHFVNEKFVREEHAGLFFSSDNEEELIEQLRVFSPTETRKWLENFKDVRY